MTMTTTVRINAPINPTRILDLLTVLVGGDPETVKRVGPREYSWTPGIMVLSNEVSQGLSALCDVHWHGDGPLPTVIEDDDTVDPGGLIEVSFDTPYGYRDEQGRDCGAWHTHLLNALREWLTTEGVEPTQAWWRAGEYVDTSTAVGSFNGDLTTLDERDDR